MSLQEEVDLLRTIPLFSKIEPSRLKLLAFTAQRLTFAPGDLLCRQGDEGGVATGCRARNCSAARRMVSASDHSREAASRLMSRYNASGS